MENKQTQGIETSAKISGDMICCGQLNTLLEIQRCIIEKNIDVHKYLRHIVDKEQGIIDFIEQYAWIFREIHCGYECKERYNCELAKPYLPNSRK